MGLTFGGVEERNDRSPERSTGSVAGFENLA
jgi:hypothetical protein